MSNLQKSTFTVLVYILLLGFSVTVNAEITAEKASTAFEWCYEFEGDTAALLDAIDLDENGVGDFSGTYAGGSNSVAGGVMTMASTPEGGNNFYGCLDSDGTLWRNVGFDRTGVTVEVRMKVIEDAGYTQGAQGVVGLAFIPDGSQVHGSMTTRSAGQYWGGETQGASLYNNDDFHTFRIAMAPGPTSELDTYSIWRDGYFLATGLGNTAYDVGTGLNQFVLGDASSEVSGKVEIDYLRIASGSWAPPTGQFPDPHALPLKNSSEFTYRYEFDGDTADLPSVLDIDGNGAVDFSDAYAPGDNSVAEGTMIMSSVWRGKYNFFGSGPSYGADSLWNNLAFSREEGFTVEWRAKVLTDNEVSEDPNDYGHTNTGPYGAGCVNFTLSDSNMDVLLYLNAEGQQYALSKIGEDCDNMSDFHNFRMAYMPAEEGGKDAVAVWRDGILLSESALGDAFLNDGLFRLLIGDVAKEGCWGDIEYEHIRFTAGAFAPEYTPPPPQIPGDANLDNKVDNQDAAALAMNWQTLIGATWAMGDFNGDGAVNDKDATLLATNWHVGVASTSTTPEPSSLGLLTGLILGIAGIVHLRR